MSRLRRHVNRRNRIITGLVILAVLLTVGYTFMTQQRRNNAQVLVEKENTNLLQSGWDYLPGAVADVDGLRVHYLGRKIVDQDGGGGQDNPPVNLYGTHFRVSGDFEIRAVMRDIVGTASLQFYDNPPIIQDEFRVEPKSLRVALGDTHATIERRDEYKGGKLSSQAPTSSGRYEFSRQSVNTLAIIRHGHNVDIKLNNAAVASFPEDGLFDSGTLWVGADAGASGDSWMLTNMNVSGYIKAVNMQNMASIAKQSTELQQQVPSRRSDFLIGAAVALGPLVADNRYAQLALGGNFGQLTTENALKWQFIQPQQSVYDFREADAIVALAEKNKLAVHGHTLVFGEANPLWVQRLPLTTAANKMDVRSVMIDHIKQTMGHYRDKINSWDVVNEPIGNDDTTLRQHIWYQAMGEGYIKEAFTAARQTNPRAKLFINEYGLEQDGERWSTFLSLVKRLKSDGVPIDGVGLQAHVYDIQNDAIDSATLRAHIQSLAQLGLIVRISEMDVDSSGGAELQARQYSEVLAACLAEAACVSWTTWGVSDAYNMWQDDDRKLQQGQDFLWGAQYQPTQAVNRLTDVLIEDRLVTDGAR